MQYPSTADSGILIRSRVIETRGASLFSGMSDGDRDALMRIMTSQEFGAGEVIVQQGEVRRNIWLLLEGACDVVKEPGIGSSAAPLPLAELGALDVFGEMTLLDLEPAVATVQAKTPVRTLRLRGGDFDDLIDGQPRLALRLMCNLLRIVSGRLRSVDDKLSGCLDSGQSRQMQDSWKVLRDRLGKLYAGSPG